MVGEDIGEHVSDSVEGAEPEVEGDGGGGGGEFASAEVEDVGCCQKGLDGQCADISALPVLGGPGGLETLLGVLEGCSGWLEG